MIGGSEAMENEEKPTDRWIKQLHAESDTAEDLEDIFEAIRLDLPNEPPEVITVLRILFAPLARIPFDATERIAELVGCDDATVQAVGERYRRAGYWGADRVWHIPFEEKETIPGLSFVLLALVGLGKIEAVPEKPGYFRNLEQQEPAHAGS
jgi:hypothetical protein